MRLLFCFLLSLIWTHPSLAQKKDTIYSDSGLKYLMTRKGKGPLLEKGQTIKIYYTGKLGNGTIVDSNVGRKPLKVTVGAGDLIDGWEEGLLLMKPREKGILWIPAWLAYGQEGVVHPKKASAYIIPPNADLIFEIEIISVENK